MSELANILAAPEDNTMKIVFGVAVGVFWVIAQIASALGKKKEQAKRERVRQEFERNAQQRRGPDWDQIANTPPPPPPPVNRPVPPPYQQQFPSAPQYPTVPPRSPQQQRHQAQRPPKQPKPPKLPKKKKLPPPPPVPVLEEAEETHRTVPGTAQVQKQVEPRVGATELRNWLKPATMRQQFIVTEILQPPLTMRPPRE